MKNYLSEILFLIRLSHLFSPRFRLIPLASAGVNPLIRQRSEPHTKTLKSFTVIIILDYMFTKVELPKQIKGEDLINHILTAAQKIGWDARTEDEKKVSYISNPATKSGQQVQRYGRTHIHLYKKKFLGLKSPAVIVEPAFGIDKFETYGPDSPSPLQKSISMQRESVNEETFEKFINTLYSLM